MRPPLLPAMEAEDGGKDRRPFRSLLPFAIYISDRLLYIRYDVVGQRIAFALYIPSVRLSDIHLSDFPLFLPSVRI